MTDVERIVLFTAYALVLLPFLLFVLFYFFKSPWRESPAGRALMLLATTLNVVLINTLLSLSLGRYFGQSAVRVVVVVGSFVSGWYLFITLVKLQWGGRRLLDEKKQRNADPEHFDHDSKRRQRRRMRRAAELADFRRLKALADTRKRK
jgi:hypothetical protein